MCGACVCVCERNRDGENEKTISSENNTKCVNHGMKGKEYSFYFASYWKILS